MVGLEAEVLAGWLDPSPHTLPARVSVLVPTFVMASSASQSLSELHRGGVEILSYRLMHRLLFPYGPVIERGFEAPG